VSPRFGEAWELLTGPAVAHRGLWAADGAPENSLAAFQAARHAGYGVELDVQLSADGEAMVFHDAELARMTGHAGRVADRTAAELGDLRLLGTEEPIPTLTEVLAEIGRHTLVLVELKTPTGAVGPLEQRVHEIIMDHAGPTAVIGFNPYSHAWFADRFPGVLRGLDSYRFNDANADHLAPKQRAAFAGLEQVAIARPHFLALSLDVVASEPARRHRAEGMPVVAWTVREPAQWEAARPHADNLIFEGFRP
jgi:glycerophosphoryl diester phosphodiesterase